MAPDWSVRVLALLVVGGALGTLARYAVAGWLGQEHFPWGTVAVNVAGSVTLGVLMFGSLLAGPLGPQARLALGVGFLGAFTTMSTFAYETVLLLEAGEHGRAALSFLLNPVACVAGALAGRGIAHALPGSLG